MALADKTHSHTARSPGRDKNGARAPLQRAWGPGTPDVVGPHGRLGFLWAVLTVAVTVAGTPWLAAWLAATAGLAGAQVARSRSGQPPRGRGRGPITVISAAGAAVVTLAAAVSPVAVAGAAGAVVVVTAGYVLGGTGARQWSTRDLLLVWLAAEMVGLAGAAPVLLRDSAGLVPPLVLLAYAMVYDASTYVVGSGAASAWEGPAAGIAAIGTVTLTVAALLAPPFRGASPWVLGALAGALAPAGPVLGSVLSGDRKVRVPALRRMDSLLVLGPIWGLAAALLLD